MKRETLIRYGRLIATQDMAKALDLLQERTEDLSFKIDIDAPREETGLPSHLDLARAGRQVKLEVVFEGDEAPPVSRRLSLLWSVAVPLGFTPHDRDPLPSPTQSVFYYYGPWQMIYERLIAEGRGDVARLSVCVAAQVDVGKWEGTRALERFVQAQLHRVGRNPGPLDGVIGPRTAAAIQAAGLKGLTLEEIAATLSESLTGVPSKGERGRGHVVIPDHEFSVESHGEIKTLRTPHGVGLVIDGPGRVVIDIREGD